MSVTTQHRNLTAHTKLILDVIKSQAGSLDKAILEGTMNAIEAGAPSVNISLVQDGDKHRLTIADTGKGIQTKDEIVRFFETFGTPHEDSEGKIWAKFRMGRGQLFSYGRNVWRTGTFQMIVDIDKNGLEWELTENLPEVKGCTIDIELYEDPTSSYYTVDRLKDAILQQVKFMSTPVFFNGTNLTIDPKSKNLKWTFEDENAYYLFDLSDSLYFYNLGAFVKIGAASRFGVSGIIVSKKQLDVNFARNDIKNSCPVYKAIQEVCYQNRVKQTRQEYRSLMQHERIAALADLQCGRQSFADIKTLGLMDKSSGGKVSPIYLRTYKGFWTWAPKGDNVADKLTESGACLCLDISVLANVGYHGEPANFFSWLCPELEHLDRQYQPFVDVRSTLHEDYQIVNSDKWTSVEKRIVKILQRSYNWGRNILIGISDTAAGWTDGRTYIAINRDFLSQNNPAEPHGAARIIALMVHELAHDCNTAGTHEHGPEFDNSFRLLCEQRISPLSAIATFRSQIKMARLDEIAEKSRNRVQRKENARNRKLGLPVAASAS